MNTPAHVVVNGLLLGRGRWRPYCLPITVGALVPDLPMVGFYLYERVIADVPERIIWSQQYFAPHWQAVFNAAHSLPLLLVAALIVWRIGATAWLAFFASMALHSIADLPLHNEDAHAHFFPLSSWHFRSPISYWDPHRHGTLFLAAECVLVIAGSVALIRRREPRAWRVVGTLILATYGAFIIFAIAMWSRG